MDFESAKAVVVAEKGTGFDPEAIRRAVRDAGYTAADLEVTAVGPVAWEEGLAVLRLSHAPRRLVLAGGKSFAELAESLETLDGRVRVRGRLHPSHGEAPPGLTVEEWETVGSPSGGAPEGGKEAGEPSAR